jgi:hypothetical protein
MLPDFLTRARLAAGFLLVIPFILAFLAIARLPARAGATRMPV